MRKIGLLIKENIVRKVSYVVAVATTVVGVRLSTSTGAGAGAGDAKAGSTSVKRAARVVDFILAEFLYKCSILPTPELHSVSKMGEQYLYTLTCSLLYFLRISVHPSFSFSRTSATFPSLMGLNYGLMDWLQVLVGFSRSLEYGIWIEAFQVGILGPVRGRRCEKCQCNRTERSFAKHDQHFQSIQVEDPGIWGKGTKR